MKFSLQLDIWMAKQNLQKFDYWKKLSKMPKSHEAEWFSELWNMWLKKLIIKNFYFAAHA